MDFIKKNEEWLIASRMERNNDEEKRLERWNEEEAAMANITTKAEITIPNMQTTLKMENFWKNGRTPAKKDSREMETLKKSASSPNV